MQIIGPVVVFLHEHGIQRGHTSDAVQTCAEIFFGWFDTLERSLTGWADADRADLVAYRNRACSRSRALTRVAPTL